MSASSFGGVSELEQLLVHAVWSGAVKRWAHDAEAMDPDEFADRVHEAWLRDPPSEVDGRIDIEPFLRAVASEFDVDGDALVRHLQELALESSAERAAAVEAAEAVLRGER